MKSLTRYNENDERLYGPQLEKHVFGGFANNKNRRACACAQSDQHLRYWLIGKVSYQNLLEVKFHYSS